MTTEDKWTEEALRESEERYRSLVEASPDIIVLADLEANLITINQQGVRLLGHEQAEEMIGKSGFDFVAPEALLQAQQTVQKTLEAGSDRDVELTLLKKDGTRFPAELSISLIRDKAGNPKALTAVLRDITKRKQAEAKIYQHTARMEALAEISQALTEVGLDVRAVLESIVRYTAEVIGDASRITLLSSDEQWFQPVVLHHPKPEVKALMESIYSFTPISAGAEWMAHILRTGQPLLLPILSQEQLRQSLQPEYVSLFEQVGLHSVLIVPLRLEGRVIGTLGLSRDQPGHPYTLDDQVFLQDLADRTALTIQNAQLFEQVQSAQERLQTLSRQLVELQEAERRHIGRELHDEIGQLLTGLKLLLEMSVRQPDSQIRASLAEAQALVNELMAQVRAMSFILRPAMLDDLGLLPALLWHFERYTAQSQIQVEFKHNGLERRFRPEVETTAYRLIQEALTNVARHAGVSQVTVRLWLTPESLMLQIEDKGCGFEAEVVLTSVASTGLSGMRERVMLLGGRLIVEARPGTGTHLEAELPLRGWGKSKEKKRA